MICRCNECGIEKNVNAITLLCDDCYEKRRTCKRCKKENFECKDSIDFCQECWNCESEPICNVKDKEGIMVKPNYKDTIKPKHYHEGVNIDPIGYGKQHFTHEEMQGFYKMNIIKYVSRSNKKNGLEDLIKSKNYLEMLIESVENDDGN